MTRNVYTTLSDGSKCPELSQSTGKDGPKNISSERLIAICRDEHSETTSKHVKAAPELTVSDESSFEVKESHANVQDGFLAHIVLLKGYLDYKVWCTDVRIGGQQDVALR